MRRPFTLGSVCSGVGGMDRGLEAAGASLSWLCEKDPQCQSVLRRHWPEVPIHDDLATLRGSYVSAVDLLAGGTPCQDLSVAGRGAGLDGEKSGLFYEFVRLAREIAAPWLLWENVAGALSSSGGEDFATVLESFTGFRPAVPADGWRSAGGCSGPLGQCVWRVLDAQGFGVAQHRERVFVVVRGRGLCPPEILLDAEDVCGTTSPGLRKGKIAPSLLSPGTGGGRRIEDAYIAVDLQQITSSTNRSNPLPGNPCPSLSADRLMVVFNGWQTPVSSLDVAPTLGRNCDIAIDGPTGLRYLMPVERERLMGWPDDWTRWGHDGQEMSDSARYRMTGNGVVSPVAEWIGRRILQADRLQEAA